jgi:hypothetical protein
MKQAMGSNESVLLRMSPIMNAAIAVGSASGLSPAQVIDQAEFEKGSCTAAAGEPGFVCDLRISAVLNGQRQTGIWGKARFFNANGWQVEQVR